MTRRKNFEGEEVRWIAPNDVERDPNVNRFYEDKRSRKMVKAGFDPRRARSAGYVVSERKDGSLIWLDGQHRGGAAEMAGQGDVPVPMTVLMNLSKGEEAEWVLLFQEDKKKTPPVDSHRLGVAAGRHPDLILDAVCKKYGVQATGGNGDKRLGAVSTAVKVAERGEGARLLDLSFGTLINAFGNDSGALEGPLIRGLAHFWENNNGNVDQSSLVNKLSKFKGGAAGLLGRAKSQQETDGRPIYKCVAATVVGTYNKGKRTGTLPTI